MGSGFRRIWIISSAESSRRASFFTRRSAISALFDDHLLERRRVDDEAPGVLEHHGGRRAGLAVEDRHLAEELAPTERRQRALFAPHELGDLHEPGLDDVHLLAVLSLTKEHVAGAKTRGRSAEKSGSDMRATDKV